MDLKLGFCVLLSLILLVAYGTEARKVVDENSESLFISQDNYQEALKAIYSSGYKQGTKDNHEQEIFGMKYPFQYTYAKQSNDEHIYSSSHIDPSVRSVFFLMDDLKIGKTISNLFFQSRSSLQFFPKEAANSIPFSLKALPNLLQRFSLSKNSPQAKAIKDALIECEFDSPIKGATKYCATSAEAMLDFVHEIMGEKTQIKALSTTTHFSDEDSTNPGRQNYTILDAPQEVAARKMVACHIMSCTYKVFYCHHTMNDGRKVFKVSLRNEANGDTVEAIGVCHLDTSEWNPSHVSFRVLGVLPGTSPVCHFLPSSNDLVWVPKTIVAPNEAWSS